MGKKKAVNKGNNLAPPLRHRRKHRGPAQIVVLTVNSIVSLACFVGAAGLVYGQTFVNNTKKTAALATPPSITVQDEPTTAATTGTTPDDSVGSVVETSAPVDSPTATTDFPIADPHAQNFLVTGADNGACDDPNSPNQVGDRGTIGERSDTIMIMRVDPSTNRAAVLSFPRDLYVKIDGTNSRNRINSAYSKDNPQRLINTINLNFQIPVDHYIQIDFCAFKTLVDAVGGVAVPFDYPARDTHTNLNVPTAGCYTFDGSSALAYVRSRHYFYLDPKTNKYKEDGASDYGRISRQQDFLRCVVAKVIGNGFDLGVAQALIDVAKNNVVTDPELTVGKQLEFAGVLRSLDPVSIQTYQIEGLGKVVGGASVIEPKLSTDNMKAVLAIFRGQASLASPPPAEITSGTAGAAVTTTTTTVKPGVTTPTTATLPDSGAQEVIKGITPPKNVTC